MSKCDFTLEHGCSHVNLLHIFGTPFLKNTSDGQLLFSIVIESGLFKYFVETSN